MKDEPPAFGMTGDVMLEAVLFNLQRVVEGSVQLLDSHFDGALRRWIIRNTSKMNP